MLRLAPPTAALAALAHHSLRALAHHSLRALAHHGLRRAAFLHRVRQMQRKPMGQSRKSTVRVIEEKRLAKMLTKMLAKMLAKRLAIAIGG